MVRALSLVTMPLLTRWLSPGAYGDAALVGTVISLASVIALAGIDIGYSRHFFSSQVGDSDAVETFCWRWTLALTLLIALLAGGLWWVLLSEAFKSSSSLSGFIILGVLASPLAAMAQARSRLMGSYLKLSMVQFVTGCAAAATSLSVAYTWRQDAWALLLAMVMGYLLPVVLLGTPSPIRLLRSSGLSRAHASRLARVGLAALVTAPAYWVLSSSDRWFLAYFWDNREVGIYSIGFTVGTLGMLVSSAITAAWLPELSRDESRAGADFAVRKSELARLLATVMLIVFLAVASAGGDIIRLFADARFHSAAAVVPWLAAGVLFYGWMHVGNTLLILHSRLHLAAWAWGVALVLSLGLNLWLVPISGSKGAALTQAVAYFVVMVLVWMAVLRVERLPSMQWFRLMAVFAAAAAAATTMHGAWDTNPLVSLSLKLPPGLFLAALCSWLLAPEMTRSVIHSVRSRF